MFDFLSGLFFFLVRHILAVKIVVESVEVLSGHEESVRSTVLCCGFFFKKKKKNEIGLTRAVVLL